MCNINHSYSYDLLKPLHAHQTATIPQSLPNTHAIADTGASATYFPPHMQHLLQNLQPVPNMSHSIQLPDGSTIHPSHIGYLPPIFDLPLEARTAFVVPKLQYPLLSIATFCDHGCTATFRKSTVDVFYRDQVIFSGSRSSSTNSSPLSHLWVIDVLPQFAGLLIHNDSEAELVAYYHAAFGSPTVPTFLSAVNANLFSIPGLTAASIRRHPPNPMATPQGHLNRVRSHLRSTKVAEEISEQLTPAVPSNITSIKVFRIPTETYMVQSDAMGRFPVRSLQGSEYMVLFIHHDTGYIHVLPMSTRSNSSYIEVYRAAIQFFWSCGHKPQFQRMDNEASADVIKLVQSTFNITVELAAPGNHRTLQAERAIATFKNHFISTLGTVHPNFPLNLWEHLLPQALATLNMMRVCPIKPTISAYEAMCGPYNFNRYPLVPLGMAVLIFEAPKTQRSTWAPHGVPGYYLGPSMPHYRCYRVWSSDTQAARVTDTLSWHPRAVHMPGSQPSALIAASVAHLIATLQRLQDSDPALAHILPNVNFHLEQLQQVYSSVNNSTRELPDFQRVLPREVVPAVVDPQRVVAPSVEAIGPVVTFQRVLDPLPPPAVEIAAPAADALAPAVPLIVPLPHPVIPIPRRSERRPRQPPRFALNAASCILVDKQAVADLSLQNPNTEAVMATSPVTYPTTYAPDPLVVTAGELRYSSLLKSSSKAIWEHEHDLELARLIDHTKTMVFKSIKHLPPGVRPKYYTPVCTEKILPDQSVKRRVRGTVADTRSTYEGPVSASTASLSTMFILFNAVVSENAEFLTCDIKDYYLGTPMRDKEYMWIPLRYISHASQLKYNVGPLAHKGNVLVEISKGMYGLAQAGRLAQDRLFEHLALHGFIQSTHTDCLFRHKTRNIAFALVVDDFAIKCHNIADAEYFFSILRMLYVITIDYTGSHHLGFTIDYQRTEPRHFRISMPAYITQALARYNHTPPQKQVDAPMILAPIHYGTGVQEQSPEDNSPILPPLRIKRLQSILGTLQHYARCVDPTLVCAVSKLASAPHTETTEKLLHHLLDYVACYPGSQVTFTPSTMELQAHSDASYLTESHGRSRYSGYQYLGTYDPAKKLPPNGAIDIVSNILDVVCASATEAEAAGIFKNGQRCLLSRETLLFLGYPQADTIIVSDNLIGVNILNGILPPKRSKSMDMRFYWIKDRIRQRQFKLTWLPGDVNLADYFTKIHPVTHYRKMRATYVTDLKIPQLSVD